VQRHGYAFGGEARVVSRSDGGGRQTGHHIYRLIWLDREFAVPEGETILGRSRDATVFIDDGSVSRRHARISVEGTSVVVEDLGSKNETTLNGQLLAGPTRIADGDAVVIGSVALTFRVFTEPAATKTVD
jgi:pSer/pThr/pTyr-binding forkhead associated (FHA) protein